MTKIDKNYFFLLLRIKKFLIYEYFVCFLININIFFLFIKKIFNKINFWKKKIFGKKFFGAKNRKIKTILFQKFFFPNNFEGQKYEKLR